MGQVRPVTKAGASRHSPYTPHSGDCLETSLPIWQSACKSGITQEVRQEGKCEKSGSPNARKRPKRPAEGEIRQDHHQQPVFENVLNRDFHAEQAGQKWVSDITYLSTQSGWLYLTVVIDLFDRKIIGWSFSTSLSAEYTTVAAVVMASKNRKALETMIFHSDRGIQYCAKAFREKLNELCPTVRQSMSGKGNCWDNACAESFFKTLKVELETLVFRLKQTTK
jgi:transposase InsO family protein